MENNDMTAVRLVVDNRPVAPVPDGLHVTGEIAAIAVGELAADRALAELHDGAPGNLAWLRFAEVVARHGRHSGQARAFVVRLATLAREVP